MNKQEIDKMFNDVETKILQKVEQIKIKNEQEIRDLDSKMISEIEIIKVEMSKECNEIESTVNIFKERLNSYRNGVYSRYFRRVSTSGNRFKTDDNYKYLLNDTELSLRVLQKYEDSTRLHKFLVDFIKRSIREACQQLVVSIEKLTDYSEIKKKESKENIEKRISSLIEEKRNEIREKDWESLESYIDMTMKPVLNEMIGEKK